MATKKGLGELLHLTIWHDNSGEGDDSSWYPNQVVVYDVATRKTYVKNYLLPVYVYLLSYGKVKLV
jgi:hypothetical protein